MKALFAQSVVIFLMLAAVPVSLPVSFAAENKCSESEMLLIQRRLDAREAAAKKNFALWDSGFGQLAKEAGKSHALAVTTTGAYLLGLGRAFLRPGTKSNFPNGNKFVLRLEETRFSQAVFKVAENLARKKGAAGVIGNSVLVSLDVVRTSSILSAAGAGAPLFVIGAISSARDHSPIFYQQTSVTTPRLVSEIFRDFDLAHSQVAEQRREATQA
ncbi:MAG TPA: hypothetical protein DCS07_03530, partial [Bdellovibrionales bacterium]|nr:hypothetical protein [Bdellovibrionales bacterium]